MNRYLDISSEVSAALRDGKPVVALESTIISHGMPYPKNVATALEVEAAVREAGAVPATIAILKGRLTAGLSQEQIEAFGKAGLSVAKASRRDFPSLVAKKLDGATTVAGTMIIAHMAGIHVFATGGIGGVHRGAERTWDVSADLAELSKTNLAVVCAGAKSILDLALTLEYLETGGVPVIGFQTNELPAFYTSRSGHRLEERADSPKEIAQLMHAKWAMGLSGGIVIANPIPEKYSIDPKDINGAIEKALDLAQRSGVKGKEVTPFLLDKVRELTGGESLESNIALVLNNARLAAQIAQSFAAIS